VWVSESSVMLHMPKTGGTYTCAALRDLCGFKLRHGQHDPIWHHPRDLEGRTVYGVIREPYEWYCSLYVHAMNQDRNARRYIAEFGGGSLEFHDVLYGMTHPWERSPEVRIGLIFDPVTDTMDGFRASGLGVWAWLVRYFYGTDEWCRTGKGWWMVDTLLNNAHLTRSLPRLFQMDLGGRPRLNTRAQREGHYIGPESYADWLTDDARRWIKQSEGPVSSLFGLQPLRGCDAPAYWGMP